MSNTIQPSQTEEENNLDPRETSVLFGPLAFWFLIICLILSIAFRFLPLIAISAFLLILSVWIYIWKEKSLKNLDISLAAPKTRIFAEEDFTVDAAMMNNKWLPLIWAEWEFQSSDVVVWSDKDKKSYIIRFLWLLSFQQVNWTIKGKGLKRGVYPLGEITVRSGDGFRFVEIEKKINMNQTLYIYPKLIPVQVPSFRPSMQWEVKGKQGGFFEDPLLINGIREYEAGDEWRRFNWRASARTGKMLTNVYQPIVSEQAIIYIDVLGFVIDKDKYTEEIEKQMKYEKKKEAAFEYFLSIIASFAVAYSDRGISIGYASNGRSYLGRKQPFVSPSPHIPAVLDQMAQVTQRVIQQKVTPLDELMHLNTRSVPLMIFCERITKRNYLWYERNKQKADVHFYYVRSNEYSEKIVTAKQINHLLAEEAVNEG